jgi:hypothetical protein
MIYKGYEITASAKTYVTWSLDDHGNPDKALRRDDVGEIVGYFISNTMNNDDEDFVEGKRIEAATNVIDEYVAAAE